jgi:protein TonB
MKKIIFIITLLSVYFSYGQTIETNSIEKVIEKPDYIYSSAGIEIRPEYSRGNNKFYKDFNKEFKLKVDKDLQGRVFITFVVEINGTLSNIKVIRDLGFGSGKETIRALTTMSKWKPGKQNAQPVRVKYSLPIGIDIKANTDFNQFNPPMHKNIEELKDKH